MRPLISHQQSQWRMVSHLIQAFLIQGNQGIENGQYLRENKWPPYLGLVPTGKMVTPQILSLEPIDSRSLLNKIPTSRLVEEPALNTLLQIWSATHQQIRENRYLILPPGIDRNPSAWHDSHNGKYPSDEIYIRNTYDRAFSISLQATKVMERKMCHLALGGTSGLGKSFFRYIVWRLLHPDSGEATNTYNTILLRDDPKKPSWYLYHEGSFYAVTSISAFFATNVAANWFNRKNAWIICDGAPPEKYIHCPTIVLSSFISLSSFSSSAPSQSPRNKFLSQQ